MNNRNIVKQDNRLVNAKYKLSRAELNFILLGIAQIKMEDTEFTEYEIKVSEIEDKFDKKQNQTQLKVFAKKLMSKVLEVPSEDGWTIFNWFSKIQYLKGQNKFRVRIDMDLRPYLLELKEQFTKYNLKYILPLKSNYSIRIYQFLKESEYKKDKRRTFTLTELHELLQSPKSHIEKYGKFKQAVLLTTQKELKEYCDIYFDFEEIKEGKKVNELVFKIKRNSTVLEEENPTLFQTLESQYDDIIGKRVDDNGVEKVISVVTPYSDFIRISFTDDSFKNIKKDGMTDLFSSKM